MSNLIDNHGRMRIIKALLKDDDNIKDPIFKIPPAARVMLKDYLEYLETLYDDLVEPDQSVETDSAE